MEFTYVLIGNTTIVVNEANGHYPGVGIAFCGPGERYDVGLGIAIAVAKALVLGPFDLTSNEPPAEFSMRGVAMRGKVRLDNAALWAAQVNGALRCRLGRNFEDSRVPLHRAVLVEGIAEQLLNMGDLYFLDGSPV